MKKTPYSPPSKSLPNYPSSLICAGLTLTFQNHQVEILRKFPQYSSHIFLPAIWLLRGILPNYAFLIFLIESKHRGVYDWQGEGKGSRGSYNTTSHGRTPLYNPIVNGPLMIGTGPPVFAVGGLEVFCH